MYFCNDLPSRRSELRQGGWLSWAESDMRPRWDAIVGAIGIQEVLGGESFVMYAISCGV